MLVASIVAGNGLFQVAPGLVVSDVAPRLNASTVKVSFGTSINERQNLWLTEFLNIVQLKNHRVKKGRGEI